MSEPRKNHLTIDGGQVKEDEHVASYKPIPESDTEFRKSKSSLSKSKEKVSSDGAEEKLLQKEDEAKITTRVDMADAKYVVGDHRNGDAKIELDANKRQFSGLTKEELLKYADDPFWVRLRWFMFVLFWAMWLCMLAGAIAIIVRAPKCAPPPPKTWFEKGPLVDMSSIDDYNEITSELPSLAESNVQGIFTFMCKDSYEVLDSPGCLEQFKSLVVEAKKHSIRVIVDLTANFVSKTHAWFTKSENRTGEFEDYFIWAKRKDYDEIGSPKPPNNWVSVFNTPAWSWSEQRSEFYLHQYGEDQPDLNFTNPAVVKRFDEVLRLWMKAGADGVRLYKARQLLVNSSLSDETSHTGAGSRPGADHTQYAYWKHRHTSDQPTLDSLLAHWAHIVDSSAATPGVGETVFTLYEEGERTELYLLQRNLTFLRPPSTAALSADRSAVQLAADINTRVANHWPALQLRSEDNGEEVISFALLLPAAPVIDAAQLRTEHNDTASRESFGRVVALRGDASLEHGNYTISVVPAVNSTAELIACARWKAGHTGYVAVYNSGDVEARGDVSALPSVPAALTVHHVSHAVGLYTNYTSNLAVASDNVLVPPKSSVVLSYVPKTTVEK